MVVEPVAEGHDVRGVDPDPAAQPGQAAPLVDAGRGELDAAGQTRRGHGHLAGAAAARGGAGARGRRGRRRRAPRCAPGRRPRAWRRPPRCPPSPTAARSAAKPGSRKKPRGVVTARPSPGTAARAAVSVATTVAPGRLAWYSTAPSATVATVAPLAATRYSPSARSCTTGRAMASGRPVTRTRCHPASGRGAKRGAHPGRQLLGRGEQGAVDVERDEALVARGPAIAGSPPRPSRRGRARRAERAGRARGPSPRAARSRTRSWRRP